MKRLASIVKDGLRGGILLGGSVSFLCSGCNQMVVDRLTEAATYSVIASSADRVINPNKVNVNVGQGSNVSARSASYTIEDFETGKYYVEEGRYDSLGPDFHNIYRKEWDKLYPNGYTVYAFKDGRRVAVYKVGNAIEK